MAAKTTQTATGTAIAMTQKGAPVVSATDAGTVISGTAEGASE